VLCRGATRLGWGGKPEPQRDRTTEPQKGARAWFSCGSVLCPSVALGEVGEMTAEPERGGAAAEDEIPE